CWARCRSRGACPVWSTSRTRARRSTFRPRSSTSTCGLPHRARCRSIRVSEPRARPTPERRSGRNPITVPGTASYPARCRALSAPDDDEDDPADDGESAQAERDVGAEQGETLLPLGQRALPCRLGRRLLGFARLLRRDDGDGVGELGRGDDRRPAGSDEQAQGDGVEADHEQGRDQGSDEHLEEGDPVDRDHLAPPRPLRAALARASSRARSWASRRAIAFAFAFASALRRASSSARSRACSRRIRRWRRVGGGLRLTLTACPESATSLMALLASTTARRDRQNRPRMTASASTESMRMPHWPNHTTTSAATAPTAPAAGRVRIQPTAILPTVFQRTFDPRRPRPEPITDPEATCVVDRANPNALEARMVAAVDDSAEKPCAGLTSVSPLPRVRMIRHPPM